MMRDKQINSLFNLDVVTQDQNYSWVEYSPHFGNSWLTTQAYYCPTEGSTSSLCPSRDLPIILVPPLACSQNYGHPWRSEPALKKPESEQLLSDGVFTQALLLLPIISVAPSEDISCIIQRSIISHISTHSCSASPLRCLPTGSPPPPDHPTASPSPDSF